MHFFWILTVEIAEEGEELFFSFENSLYKKIDGAVFSFSAIISKIYCL